MKNMSATLTATLTDFQGVLPMFSNQVIVLARKHVDNNVAMKSSARLCLEDAVKAFDAGEYEVAKMRALKSLAYSVGIFHADYQRAAK